MRRRLVTLIDFYASPSALLFLIGLCALFLRLTNIGPNLITTVVALVCIGAGLPLRMHSLTSGLHTLLEEERVITHSRLAKLEDADDPGATEGDR